MLQDKHEPAVSVSLVMMTASRGLKEGQGELEQRTVQEAVEA